MQEVGLIRRKQLQGTVQYEICKEGLALLRTLRTKKLRIIFNITHDRSDLSSFNHNLLGIQNQAVKQRTDNCLTISRRPGELQGGRVILLLNAYEQPQGEPAMVVLGYLAASVFLYHHKGKLDEGSPLTVMLAKLKQLLAATDVHNLTQEMTYKKGYSKQPHFLCLLPSPTPENAFRDFYKYTPNKDFFNDAVDALIDFLPQRSSLAYPTTPEQLREIGKQFEEKVLGRQIFNFQFTGSTIENLCFQCCQAFNANKPLNLSLVYAKVIDNQKARLEDEAKERYLAAFNALFEGQLPLASHLLLQKHNELADAVMDDALQCASYCMSLPQYQNLQRALKERFKQGLIELQASNLQKIQQSCRECFSILSTTLEQSQMDSQALSQYFRTVLNKLQLFLSECSKNFQHDPSFRIFEQYLSRIQAQLLGKLSNSAVQTAERLELLIQECRVDAQGLKYRLRVQQGLNRELQYQYNLQYSILSDFKLKVAPTPSPPAPPAFSLDLNKARKRIQELEEEVQDRALHIQELQGVIERFQGLGQREKLKHKFSRELTEMASDVTKQFNQCHGFLREVKKINQLQEEIKQGFAKEKQSLIQEKRKGQLQLATRQAQFQKVIKQKTMLQEVIRQAKQSIQVYKQVDQNYKESISKLENTLTQAQCLLADTENDFELFKKALALTAQQQLRGSRLESLNKFYRVCSNPELKELLKPFLRR